MLFNQLPETSRVWIYQSQTPFSDEVKLALQSKLDTFISGWAAHGKGLFGAADIIDDYFIVLAVDESQILASGCSIDTSVQFIKSIEKLYGLDLFNRLQVLISENDVKKIVHFSEVSNYPEAIIYNPLVTTLKDLRDNWKVKVKDSQFA